MRYEVSIDNNVFIMCKKGLNAPPLSSKSRVGVSGR